MSFADSDFYSAALLNLADRIKVETEDGKEVTGKVIELALLGDEMEDIGITLLLDDGTILRIDRKPEDLIDYDF